MIHLRHLITHRMTNLPRHPSHVQDTWWQSYERRIDDKFEFYSIPPTFLLCCCGCGIPCQDIWNYSRQLAQKIGHGIRRKPRSRKDRQYHQDLVAGLNRQKTSSLNRIYSDYHCKCACTYGSTALVRGLSMRPSTTAAVTILWHVLLRIESLGP